MKQHPTEAMLLAYVRRQQRSLWPVDIQEHVANCSLCKERCAAFELMGNTLETWARASAEDPLYAMVSTRVMRKIREPKVALTTRLRHSILQVHVALPVAIACVLLLLLCIRLGTNIVHVAKSQLSEPTPPIVYPQPTRANPVRIVPFSPAPTVALSPTVTGPVVTATPHNNATIALNTSCTTEHMEQNQLRVCGAHFTPNTTVAIDYRTSTGRKTHIVQVAADGTFIDVVFIRDCKDVPNSIYAHDITKSSETAQITQNITIGKCQNMSNSH